jgi:hypothetical protein
MSVSGFLGQTMSDGPAAISIGNETDVTRDIAFHHRKLYSNCDAIRCENYHFSPYVASSRGEALDDGDTKVLYARLMSFMLGGLRAPLPVIHAKLTKQPRIRNVA